MAYKDHPEHLMVINEGGAGSKGVCCRGSRESITLGNVAILASGRFQWPPSTRRERRHPPINLLPTRRAWNRISREIRASNLCRLAQCIRAIARALLILSRTDRPKSSFAVYLGRNVDPKSAIRWGSRIPLDT